MEATTLLTLILLAFAGARNIPANMDEPSEELQQIIGDSLTSYANTVSEGEVSYKDPVEDAVSAGDLDPTSNKDINEEETYKDHDYNFAAMDIVEAKDLENKIKEDENQGMTAGLNPIEVTNDDNKTKEGEFEDRGGILKIDYCLPGSGRIGSDCIIEDKDKPEDNVEN